MKARTIGALALCVLASPALGAPWLDWTAVESPGVSDAELEMLVRVAYSAATGFARAHGNYFARDGVFAPLRDKIATEITAAGVPDVTVPETAADSFDAARQCLAGHGTELRIATNIFGDGLSLVAVTSHRAFSYNYDPHEAAEIAVHPADDCVKP